MVGRWSWGEAATAVAVAGAAVLGWLVADPVQSVGGLPDGTIGQPQWFACCELSNQLSWGSLARSLVPVAAASCVAGWWHRIRAASIGAFAGIALAISGEAMTSTARTLPASWTGRGYVLAVALLWPVVAAAAAAGVTTVRRAWGPSRP